MDNSKPEVPYETAPPKRGCYNLEGCDDGSFEYHYLQAYNKADLDTRKKNFKRRAVDTCLQKFGLI